MYNFTVPFPVYSYTDVPKSYVHDLTLSAELHMNGTACASYATL